MKNILPKPYRRSSKAIILQDASSRKFLVLGLLLTILCTTSEPSLAKREVIFDAPNQTYDYFPVISVHEDQIMKADAYLFDLIGQPVLPPPSLEFYGFTKRDLKLTPQVEYRSDIRYVQGQNVYRALVDVVEGVYKAAVTKGLHIRNYLLSSESYLIG